jgi:tetratricopeptide (TPR) repeat protein
MFERGHTIDRFVIIGLLGRGGMGEVYAAYDPQLDRKVAIKLLRSRGDNADGRTRLMREAQAIAKLQHPNVIVVHDVGTFDDDVFIAMEFVEGRTLSGWLHAAARSRADIMRVFMAAGRGLAAAHAAGLVHRDFKPDNVMVTNDGQVRVMDFGLARQADAATPAAVADAPGQAALLAKLAEQTLDPDATGKLGADNQVVPPSSGGYLAAKLTMTGAVLGTPAYMAPEQFAGQATDASTDQFSFCVTLYEFLYGHRPFEGDTYLTLMAQVVTGDVRAEPAKSGVPSWMRKVLLRGLSPSPAQRFPSMNALLAALEVDPTIRPKRVAGTLALAAGFALALVAARRNAGTQHAVCRGGAERWRTVWEAGGASSPRKEAVRDAFMATGKTYAAQAFTGASRIIDDYVGKWIDMYTDACEATHVRGEQSTEVLDLRVSCLNERLGSVAALVDVFARGGETMVQNAVSAAGALPRVDRCAQVALLRAVVTPPEDEETRRRVEQLRAEKARLVALRDSGNCGEAVRLADQLLPKVRALGYVPLVAEALEASTFQANVCLPPRVEIERHQEAYTAAIAARDDELAARAATLAGNLATLAEIGDYGAGKLWLAIARSTLSRIGGNALLSAWTRSTEAGLCIHAEDWNCALAAYQQARLEKERLLGRNHPDVAMSDLNIGWVLQLAGHLDEAADSYALSREGFARVLGPDHPSVAHATLNQGDTLVAMKRYKEGHALLSQALDIFTRAGSDEWLLAFARTSLGSALLGEGRPREALPLLEAALAARLAKDTGAEQLAETRFALARALWSRPEQRGRARTLAEAARADYAHAKMPTKVAELEAWLTAPTAAL